MRIDFRPFFAGRASLAAIAMVTLTACGGPSLDDPRTRALLALPGPQHYAERNVAQELTARCGRYGYDADLADAMSKARSETGLEPVTTMRAATTLETDVKQRSLASFYGQSSYAAMNACETLDKEVARQSPLSVLLRKKG